MKSSFIFFLLSAWKQKLQRKNYKIIKKNYIKNTKKQQQKNCSTGKLIQIISRRSHISVQKLDTIDGWFNWRLLYFASISLLSLLFQRKQCPGLPSLVACFKPPPPPPPPSEAATSLDVKVGSVHCVFILFRNSLSSFNKVWSKLGHHGWKYIFFTLRNWMVFCVWYFCNLW